MSKPVDIVAIVTGKPGTEADIEAALRACVAATLPETGCISYVAHRDTKVPARYAFIERWESQEALDAHFKMPHLKTLRDSLQALDASLQALFLDAFDD